MRLPKPFGENLVYKIIARKGLYQLGETKSGDRHLPTWPLVTMIQKKESNNFLTVRIIIINQLNHDQI